MEINKNFESILSEIWLEKNECKLYLASLKVWTSSASILAKKTDIPRTTARYNCEQLVKKQIMIESMRWNTKLFTPEDPSRLKNLLIIQKNELEEKENKVDMIMKDLIKMKNPYTTLPKVSYYEWIDSVMKMLIDNHSKIEGDTYEFSAHIPLMEKFPKEIWEYSKIHMEHRKNNKNFVLDCIENKQGNNDENIYSNLFFKYYPENNLDLKTHIQVDWDRIAIISAHWEKPMWIDIHHKEIAEDLKKIFMQLWENLPDN